MRINHRIKLLILFSFFLLIQGNILEIHANDKRFLLRLQEERFEKIKKFFKNLKIPMTKFNMQIDIKPLLLPPKDVRIIQFGADFVIISANKLLGFKHCFYKAIEYFYSKYSKFFIQVEDIYRDHRIIIVKFIACNIEP